mgnify:CR=1 FL=1
MNAIIYCSISNSKDVKLLDYQEAVLKNILISKHIKIDLVVKEIKEDKQSYEFDSVVNRIKHSKIKYLAIYDDTRITTNKERFLEFEMLCNMYNVQIIKYK